MKHSCAPTCKSAYRESKYRDAVRFNLSAASQNAAAVQDNVSVLVREITLTAQACEGEMMFISARCSLHTELNKEHRW